MTYILVLEDEHNSRAALVKMLQDISAEITVSAAATYREAEQFLDSGDTYDLFMLDINLDTSNPEDLSGITFAKSIRQRRGYEFTPVVMITSIANMEMSAYREIHCYQFIVKPFFALDIEDVVRKVMTQQKQLEMPFVMIKKEGINYKIQCDDIIYVRAIPRGVCLCLKDEQIEVPYLTIRQLMEQLPPDDFIQCHRMFVIQAKYVKYLDLVNQVVSMEGYQEAVDIGVTYKSEVRRRFHG